MSDTGASSVTASPWTATTVRSAWMTLPAAIHVSSDPSRTMSFIPMNWIHAAVTGRSSSTGVPGVSPVVDATCTVVAPEGT